MRESKAGEGGSFQYDGLGESYGEETRRKDFTPLTHVLLVGTVLGTVEGLLGTFPFCDILPFTNLETT